MAVKAVNPGLKRKDAADIFTDREEPRKAFWDLYHALPKDGIEVLHYYGVGGIGKSCLLKQLQKELLTAGKKRVVEHSFEQHKSKEHVLFDLSRQMMKVCSGLKFPLFEYAFEKYKVLTGEALQGRQLLEEDRFLDHHLVGSVADVAGINYALASPLVAAANEAVRLISYLAKKYEQQCGEHADLYEEISLCNNAQTLLSEMHMYFAQDAYNYFSGHQEEPIVIMLDGYEVFVNRLQDGNKASAADQWICGEGELIYSIPYAVWVIAGREKLHWSEELLPQENTHLIGQLDVHDAMDYFMKSGISDEKLAVELCSLTEGTPVYMDLCRKQYRRMKQNNPAYEPKKSDFGQNTGEIALRFLRDMSITEQGILYLLSCLPNTWNDAAVEQLVQTLKYDFSHNEFRLIKEMTLVEQVDAAEPSYRLHETFRNIVFQQIPEDERKRICTAVKAYYLEKIKKYRGTDKYLHTMFLGLMEVLEKCGDKLNLSLKEVSLMAWAAMNMSCYGCSQGDSALFRLEEYIACRSKDADYYEKILQCLNYHGMYALHTENMELLHQIRRNIEKNLLPQFDDNHPLWIRAMGICGKICYWIGSHEEGIVYLESVFSKLQTDSISYDVCFDVCSYLANLYLYGRKNRKQHDEVLNYLLTLTETEWTNQCTVSGVESHEAEKRYSDMIEILKRLKNYQKALQKQRTQYQRQIRGINLEDWKIGLLKMNLAECCREADELEEELVLLQDTENIFAGQTQHMDLYSEVLSALAKNNFSTGNYDSAKSYMHRVLDLHREFFPYDWMTEIDILEFLAEIYAEQKSFDEAVTFVKEACTIADTKLGIESQLVLRLSNTMIQYYRKMESNEEAVDYLEQVLLQYSQIDNPDIRQQLYYLEAIMYFCNKLNDPRRALKWTIQQLHYMEDAGLEDSDTYWWLLDCAGGYYSELGFPEKALKIHEEVYKWVESHPDNEEILLIDILLSLSADYEELEDYESCLRVDRKMYELICETAGADSEEAKQFMQYIEDDLNNLKH